MNIMSNIKSYIWLFIFVYEFDAVFCENVEDLNCDFNNGFCLWKPAVETSLILQDGRTRQRETLDGPIGSPDRKGKYVLLAENTASLKLPKALNTDMKPICLSFYYYMSAAYESESISIIATPVGSKQNRLLFYRDELQGRFDRWHHFQATIHPIANSDISITLKKQAMTSVIAIDDIEATLGDCPTTDNYQCDFDQADEENIDCPWLLPFSKTKNYQWWASWPGERKLAIADADHSTKSKHGGYLTAYDNGKATDDEQVGLRLPDWTQHSSYCFSFWFYFAENVHIQLLESTQGPRELRDVLGVNKFCDRKWCQKQYQINGAYGKRAWLSLIMSRTALTTGVAAFDSFSLVPGECRKAVSCDFSSDFCGYQVTGPWVLGTGRLTNPTRVANDFVRPTNVSRYAYPDFTVSESCENQVAQLVSNRIEKRGQFCLKLSYYNWGDITSFSIHKDEALIVEYSPSMIRKKSWTTDFFSIQSKTYFNLEFVLNSSGCNTFFAIDTIELNEGTCEQNGVELPEIQLEHPSPETPVETSLSSDEAEVNQDEADVNQDEAVVLLEQSLKTQALSLVETKKKVQENLALKRALVDAHATNNKLMSYIKEFQNLARRNIGHLSISGATSKDVTAQTSSLTTHAVEL